MTIKPNTSVQRLSAYVPGEQPREPGFIKINTNEFPYPPAAAVIDALRAIAESPVFHKYPNATSSDLRAAVAQRVGVNSNQVLVGNGSDEVLRLICHAFLCPENSDQIGMLYPTYTLYRTLAEMFGCSARTFETAAPDYAIPQAAYTAPVKVFFLANPNPPIGTLYSEDDIRRLASADPERLVVVDEAYVDFAPEGSSSVKLVAEFPNVLVTRSFSKSFGLAGMRVGLVMGAPELIAEMDKIRDSYNLNLVSQKIAEAAWDSADYYSEKCRQICADRDYLGSELEARGFVVPESQGNFVLARHPEARKFFLGLRERKILVRYFDAPSLQDALRISIGTRAEVDSVLKAIEEVSEPA